jgi:hypothetical protein
MRQVICMKWGELYGPEYVNRLYGMVRRNLDGPLRFVCLTDDATGIHTEVECHPCPEIELPLPQRNRGFRKVTLWAAELLDLQGDVLFLDLDLVVVDRLEPFFEHRPDESFVVIHNWTQPDKRIGNTSAYRFRVGSHPYLLENLVRDQQTLLARYTNSQTYISENVDSIAFWPDAWCRSFKVHCIPAWPLRLFREPVLPPGTKLVAFPGLPNPDDALAGRWPARGLKRLYKQIRPATWIGEYWRE